MTFSAALASTATRVQHQVQCMRVFGRLNPERRQVTAIDLGNESTLVQVSRSRDYGLIGIFVNLDTLKARG